MKQIDKEKLQSLRTNTKVTAGVINAYIDSMFEKGIDSYAQLCDLLSDEEKKTIESSIAHKAYDLVSNGNLMKYIVLETLARNWLTNMSDEQFSEFFSSFKNDENQISSDFILNIEDLDAEDRKYVSRRTDMDISGFLRKWEYDELNELAKRLHSTNQLNTCINFFNAKFEARKAGETKVSK